VRRAGRFPGMMRRMDHPLVNREIYLERMAKPLREKLRVARYIHPGAKTILDVGCADGAVTLALAELNPDKRFLGIDLDADFIALASERATERGLANVSFKRVYLRELLARAERYDTVLFISVLHEFFSYGEGISSVLKALADAEELLVPGGDIVIRDMILLEYSKRTDYLVDAMLTRIAEKGTLDARLRDFTQFFGPVKSVYALNHFLLKYMYEENWEREGPEHYVPVTVETYETIFSLLGMELVLRDSQLLPFLRQKWIADFGFGEDELAPLISTGFLVARKRK
jgi:2-polyprenyl-3-methyl-5-hydroxy-6-metoxy-1,4-benzoquinol methylase